MFFYIGNHTQNLLTKVHDKLFLDDGWSTKDNLWYKGYSTDCVLHDNINNIVNGYMPNGIWCIIQYTGTGYMIYHPHMRGFPIYKNENDITNLQLDGFSLERCTLEYNNLYNEYTDVINNITSILIENCQKFYNNYKQPFEVWCTGGVDSLTLIGILEYAKLPYNIYIAKPKEFKGNIRDFEGSISEYISPLLSKMQNDRWGYEILSNFQNPKILTTGFYGDEFVCRGPYQLNYLANCNNSTILDLVKPSDYMYRYLKRTNAKENFKKITIDESLAKSKIKKSLGNDYQIWHLDNTITFCPYFDERIIDNVLSLPVDVILGKSLDATIQKDVLKNCFSDIIQLLDTHKNTELGRVNFFLKKELVNFKFCKEIITV